LTYIYIYYNNKKYLFIFTIVKFLKEHIMTRTIYGTRAGDPNGQYVIDNGSQLKDGIDADKYYFDSGFNNADEFINKLRTQSFALDDYLSLAESAGSTNEEEAQLEAYFMGKFSNGLANSEYVEIFAKLEEVTGEDVFKTIDTNNQGDAIRVYPNYTVQGSGYRIDSKTISSTGFVTGGVDRDKTVEQNFGSAGIAFNALRQAVNAKQSNGKPFANVDEAYVINFLASVTRAEEYKIRTLVNQYNQESGGAEAKRVSIDEFRKIVAEVNKLP
jgi:hypothetical protein